MVAEMPFDRQSHPCRWDQLRDERCSLTLWTILRTRCMSTPIGGLAYRNQGFDLKCPTWLLNLDPSEVNGGTSATKRSRTRRRTRSAKRRDTVSRRP